MTQPMTQKRILLTTLNSKYIHTNTAIRLLYALNKKRANLEWREFINKENLDDIATYCGNYDLVAFSCYIWNIVPTLEIALKIKALHPHLKIMLGGPEVSYGWEEIISLPQIDFIIPHEGEIPFGNFLSHYNYDEDLSQTKGLIFKQDGKIVYNPETELFPLSNYNSILTFENDPEEELQNKIIYLEASRGCPYRCGFCLAGNDNLVRNFDLERIEKEIAFATKTSKVIKFLDRTFNVNKERTLEIFKMVLRHAKSNSSFQFEITAEIFHPTLIEFIKQNVPKGLFRFEIGIQTLTDEANKAVKRNQSFEKIEKLYRESSQIVEIHLDLIAGLPYESYVQFNEGFDKVFQLWTPELQLGFLKFLKGTPIRERSGEHQYLYEKEPPYTITQSKYLSREDLHLIKRLETALEIYWNKKRALSTLKYLSFHISPSEFLTKLGVFFCEKVDEHRYSLEDVYDILKAFVKTHYPQEQPLYELLAIDYYLHYQQRPRQKYLFEINKQEKQLLLKRMGLTSKENFITVLPLTFDYHQAVESGKVSPGNYLLLIEYQHKLKPIVTLIKEKQTEKGVC